MKTVIQIPALVESTGDDKTAMATTIALSVENGQVTINIPEWETLLEVPCGHLSQALATLAPAEKEPAISPVLVQHLGQKISRMEQQIAATPQQRLELEAMGESLEDLRREVLPRLEVLEKEHILTGQIAASFQGQCGRFESAINHLASRASAMEDTLRNYKDRIAVLENNLAEPPAETSALALYGGEQ